MKTLMVVIGGVLVGAAPAAAQARAGLPAARPFQVSSVGSTYPFALAVRGSYRVFADSVVVEVASGEVVSQIPAEFGERGNAWSITVGLGLGHGTIESWDSEGDTPAVKVGSALPTGGRITMGALRFVVRGTDTLTLRDRWFAFELGVQQRLGVEGLAPGPLFSYACSEEYLLGPTPESEARARAQRKRYSTVC